MRQIGHHKAYSCRVRITSLDTNIKMLLISHYVYGIIVLNKELLYQ